MTVIIGVTDEKGNVWFGADRGAFDCESDEYYISPTPKICKREVTLKRADKSQEKISILIGTAGSCRFWDIIDDFDFSALTMLESETPKRFIKRIFIPKLQNELSDYGYKDKDFNILIGISSIDNKDAKIYEIQDDLSVMDVPDHGHAIGVGGTAGRAAIFAISKLKNKLVPKKIVELSLLAAEATITTVRGPFDIMTTGDDSGEE